MTAEAWPGGRGQDWLTEVLPTNRKNQRDRDRRQKQKDTHMVFLAEFSTS